MRKIYVLQSRDIKDTERFAKFGWRIRMLCHKKIEKSACQTRVRQIATEMFVRPDAELMARISHLNLYFHI